jgi:hypothetical protein
VTTEPTIRMRPTEHQWAFISSRASEKAAVAARGEGKTSAGLMSVTYHASQMPAELRPIPGAILRDTFANLDRTLISDFRRPHPGSFQEELLRNGFRIRKGGRLIELPGMWHAQVFGMDSDADLNKFQSLQLAWAWLEEPAPAAVADIGGGIQEAAWSLAQTSLRYPCPWRFRQITANYPEEEHWFWQRFYAAPDLAHLSQEERDKVRLLVRIPTGDNPHLPAGYREDNAAALVSDPGLLARLVRGDVATIYAGEAVTPEYRESVHRAKEELLPLPGVPGFRFWDGWLNPTCSIWQITPSGFVQCYATIRGANMGVKQLIEAFVKPALATRFARVTHWRDRGDPTMATPDQSDVGKSAALKIEALLTSAPGQPARFEKGPSRWDPRRQGAKELLSQMVDGQPRFRLCRSDRVMHKALSGGWHYRKDSSGRVLRDLPVKDIHSHPGDTFGYGAATLLQMQDVRPPRSVTAVLNSMPRMAGLGGYR